MAQCLWSRTYPKHNPAPKWAKSYRNILSPRPLTDQPRSWHNVCDRGLIRNIIKYNIMKPGPEWTRTTESKALQTECHEIRNTYKTAGAKTYPGYPYKHNLYLQNHVAVRQHVSCCTVQPCRQVRIITSTALSSTNTASTRMPYTFRPAGETRITSLLLVPSPRHKSKMLP